MDNHHKEIVFDAAAKSKGKAYLLWACLGWLGAHRLYAGRTRSGALQGLMTLSVVGWPIAVLMWLVDFFLIPDMVNEHNMQIIHALNHEGQEQLAPQNDALSDTRADAISTDAPALDGKRARMLEDLRATGYSKPRRDPSFLYR
ncbi:MAG: TM2 domain-containing protein [Pseudomonadota bacterium]